MTDSVDRRPTVAAQPRDDVPAVRGDAAAATLAARFASGAPGAFEAVVERYHDKVHRLAYRVLGWAGDADDVVQEVFLAALKNAARFRGDADLGTWLTTITLNKCRGHRRGLFTRLRLVARLGTSGGRQESPPADAPAAAADTFERVRSALNQLSPREREVIVLHYLEQTPVEQIAAMLGLKRGAVEVRLHRARAKLRTVLGVTEEWP
jgi:RNA polymerase sigma-70 factor (ECF subfamily)